MVDDASEGAEHELRLLTTRSASNGNILQSSGWI